LRERRKGVGAYILGRPGATQIKAMKALKIEDFFYNSLIH